MIQGRAANAAEGEPHLDRALPQLYMDLLLEGVRPSGQPSKGEVFGALVKIAMSACARGWTEVQFLNEVTARSQVGGGRHRKWKEHQLWMQLREFSRTDEAAMKTLRKVWRCAIENLGDQQLRTGQDIRNDAIERAFQWADRIAEGRDGFTVTEAAVMGYVIAQTEQRGMMRVTCPAREAAEFAKVSIMTAYRTLGVLVEKNCLVRESKGRRGKPGNRRAAIYRLVDPCL